MKPEDKTLTYQQARELKWFCGNVIGIRQELHGAQELVEKIAKFDQRIARLEKTCGLIESFLGEKIESNFPKGVFE